MHDVLLDKSMLLNSELKRVKVLTEESHKDQESDLSKRFKTFLLTLFPAHVDRMMVTNSSIKRSVNRLCLYRLSFDRHHLELWFSRMTKRYVIVYDFSSGDIYYNGKLMKSSFWKVFVKNIVRILSAVQKDEAVFMQEVSGEWVSSSDDLKSRLLSLQTSPSFMASLS